MLVAMRVGIFGLFVSVCSVAAMAVAEGPRLAPEGLPSARVSARAGLVGGEGDLVYRMAETRSPLPIFQVFSASELHADGIRLEAGGGGALVRYSVTVVAFGSDFEGFCGGGETDAPWQVTTALWTDTQGDPAVGRPASPIAGTECEFVGVPKSSLVTLECEPGSGVEVPEAFWLTLDVQDDGDCAFWAISTDEPEVGFSEDDFCISPDAGGSWTCGLDFTDPDLFANFFGVDVVIEGRPWACCDLTNFACANVVETACEAIGGVFTEGELCNDLAEPCSAAGACCDTASGRCVDGFASECVGFLEAFTPGASCEDVVCETPANVPAVSQWGMLVLVLLLLTGLTVRFGRRGSAGASPSR